MARAPSHSTVGYCHQRYQPLLSDVSGPRSSLKPGFAGQRKILTSSTSSVIKIHMFVKLGILSPDPASQCE